MSTDKNRTLEDQRFCSSEIWCNGVEQGNEDVEGCSCKTLYPGSVSIQAVDVRGMA